MKVVALIQYARLPPDYRSQSRPAQLLFKHPHIYRGKERFKLNSSGLIIRIAAIQPLAMIS